MYKAIIFGGTTEGRLLHEYAALHKIPALTCVATQYGGDVLDGGEVKVGRLGSGEMAEFFECEKPVVVIDATHPYATEVSRNIENACRQTDTEYLRVIREDGAFDGGGFDSLQELIEALKQTQGGVFATLGVKEARALTALPDYKNRLHLRILPSVEGLSECLGLGYPPARIICMQGPFSRELNLAMFRDSGAKILVTKQSGGAGGFLEKVSAARELEMNIFVLGRPKEASIGVSVPGRPKESSAGVSVPGRPKELSTGVTVEQAKERLAAL